MAIDQETVLRVAHLARLQLAEQDIDRLAGSLNDILHLVDQLREADLADVLPLAHPLEVDQPLRDDRVTEPDERARALPLAPATEADLYLVPRVIE